MNDQSQYDGIPAWGWVVLIIAIAICVGMVVKALSTGT